MIRGTLGILEMREVRQDQLEVHHLRTLVADSSLDWRATGARSSCVSGSRGILKMRSAQETELVSTDLTTCRLCCISHMHALIPLSGICKGHRVYRSLVVLLFYGSLYLHLRGIYYNR